MKKSIIYSITIYLLLSMIILLQKPNILYDDNNNIKSWIYFKTKLINGFDNINEFVCLPTVFILCSLLSFIIAKNLN